MLQDPMDFARRVCQQIGVDHKDCLPELKVWADSVQDTNNDKFVEALTSRSLSRPDHKHRMGRWKENLSKQEIEMVFPIVNKAAKTFDYELEHEIEAQF